MHRVENRRLHHGSFFFCWLTNLRVKNNNNRRLLNQETIYIYE